MTALNAKELRQRAEETDTQAKETGRVLHVGLTITEANELADAIEIRDDHIANLEEENRLLIENAGNVAISESDSAALYMLIDKLEGDAEDADSNGLRPIAQRVRGYVALINKLKDSTVIIDVQPVGSHAAEADAMPEAATAQSLTKDRVSRVSNAIQAAIKALQTLPDSPEYDGLAIEALNLLRYAFEPLIDLRYWAGEADAAWDVVRHVRDAYNCVHKTTKPLWSLAEVCSFLVREANQEKDTPT